MRPLCLPPEKPVIRSRSNRNKSWNNGLVKNWKKRTSRLYTVTCLFNVQVLYIMPNAGLDEAHREGNGSPLQYSCLENPMDGGAWQAALHGVTESCTRLSDFTFTFHFHALEKEMATHSSVLAWRLPGTGEPGGLLSMGSHRVRHD